MLVGTNVCLSALKGRQKVPTRTVSVTCPAFSPQQNADDLYEDQGYVAECDEYIRIFECICHKYVFGHSFVWIFWYKYIRIFVRVKKFIQIYSDIRSCHFHDMNIFGYSFVSKSIRMSHSGPDVPVAFVVQLGRQDQTMKWSSFSTHFTQKVSFSQLWKKSGSGAVKRGEKSVNQIENKGEGMHLLENGKEKINPPMIKNVHTFVAKCAF